MPTETSCSTLNAESRVTVSSRTRSGCHLVRVLPAAPYSEDSERCSSFIAIMYGSAVGAASPGTIHFAARWGVQTGGVSPWSSVVSFTVPMGG